jgi:2-oxoglutarate dehydrogenase E2 component (dihydrolipoamide succinyltransferase)
VRRLAAETGIDPASVSGSGKAGRVTKGDMLSASEAKPAAAPTAPSPAAPASLPSTAAPVVTSPAAAGERQTRRKLSPLRQRIAQRLVAAQHEAAMLTTFNEVDMSAVMALRARYQDDFVKKNGLKLGFMSFFTKAVVHALREVPAINAQLEGDHVVENHYFDVGVAVSTEKGLMVPVIRDCDQLGMADIEKAIGNAAKKARDGKITLQDLEGGVFTITNGGIFGSMLSTPIINPPQSAILGLHAINDRPMAVNGQVVIRPMMYLALSYDHRIVDGKEAVTFLVKVKQAIEDPTRLLLSI